MSDELDSIRRQLAAVQRIQQEQSRHQYECEQELRVVVDRVADLESSTIHHLKSQVRNNREEIRRDRYYVLLAGIGFVGLIAAGFYFYAQMSLEDQRQLAKELSGKIAGIIGAIVVAAIGVERWSKK